MKNLSFEMMEKLGGGDLTGGMCYANALASFGDASGAERIIATNLFVSVFPMCAPYMY